MSLKQQVRKVRSQAEHLLDLFIGLREKYAMLHALAFDKELAVRVGRGPQARGHLILQNSLLYNTVSDVVKLALDSDKRVPSAYNILGALHRHRLREWLRSDYSVVPPMVNVSGTSLPVEVLADIKADEKERLVAQFEQTWSGLHEDWGKFESSDRLLGLKTWRDKLIAHSELRHNDGKYELTDLSSLGLKWRDIREIITELQGIVDRINILCRGASFAWEMLDEQLEEATSSFWALVGDGSG